MKIVVGKVVFVGREGVGKTSMVLRYIEKHFNHDTSTTIGASFFLCKIDVGNIAVKMQIWDTAGMERFRSMIPMFYRNANAAVLVFDITRKETFHSMQDWAMELKKNIEEPILLFVVANKMDLCDKRQVSQEDAIQYSHSIGAIYYECSAANAQGIEELFLGLATNMVRLSDKQQDHRLKITYDNKGMEQEHEELSHVEEDDDKQTSRMSWTIRSFRHNRAVRKNCC